VISLMNISIKHSTHRAYHLYHSWTPRMTIAWPLY